MNRLRQIAINAVKYPLRHPSNQGYPVTTLVYTQYPTFQKNNTDEKKQIQEPLWKTKCQELVDTEYKGLQKAQMKEHLDHMIYDGKRSSDLLKLYAAENRRAAIDSGLKNDTLPSMSKDIYDFLTQKKRVSDNRLHEVQELGVKAADLDVIYEELPEWNLSVTAVNPDTQQNTHPLVKSHIQKSFEFKNAQQCNGYVQRIGEFLYKMDHHPQCYQVSRQLHQQGGKLTVKMTSHFLHNNVTDSDVKVARQLDTLYYATKISSVQFLKMRLVESLPVGSLLLGLFGASLLGILMIKNFMSYKTASLRLFELNTVPERSQKVDNHGVQTNYLINDIYTPHYAQKFDKKKDLIYNRPDYSKNELVNKVFIWDRGSKGYEINKCAVEDLDYVRKQSEGS